MISKSNIASILLFSFIIEISKINFYIRALVWGSSVKHNPQKVGKEHTLADEDVVQIIKRV